MSRRKRHKYPLALKIGKHRFYIPKTPSELPTARAMGFWTAIREYTLHITFDDLEVMTRRMKQAINDSDLATAGYLVSTLEAYRKLEASKNTIFNVAKYYIFMDGEGLDVSDEWIDKKREVFDSNPDIQAFFLNITNELLRALRILSEDIQIGDYLNRTETLQVEKIFMNSIQDHFTSTSKNQSMTSYYPSQKNLGSNSTKRWKKSLSNFWKWL